MTSRFHANLWIAAWADVSVLANSQDVEPAKPLRATAEILLCKGVGTVHREKVGKAHAPGSCPEFSGEVTDSGITNVELTLGARQIDMKMLRNLCEIKLTAAQGGVAFCGSLNAPWDIAFAF